MNLSDEAVGATAPGVAGQPAGGMETRLLVVQTVEHLVIRLQVAPELPNPAMVALSGVGLDGQRGHPARLLRWHEGLAWVGSLLVLVHAGVHFNAILGWLAVAAMLINVVSGLTGKFLLDRARRRMEDARQRMRERGLGDADMADRLYWDSLTFDVVKQWRVVHFPITLAFTVLALAHILATFLFWGWN